MIMFIASTTVFWHAALWVLQSIGFLLELLVTLSMFVWWVGRRRFFLLRAAMSLAIMVTVALLWTWVMPAGPWTAIARCLLFYLMCYLAALFCLDLDYRQALFFLAGCVALQHCVYSAAQILIVLVTGRILGFDPSGSNSGPLYPVLLVPLFFLGYWFFARPLRGRLPHDIGGRFLLLVVGILLCVNVFSCLFDSYIANTSLPAPAYMMFVLNRIVTCVFLLMMLQEMADRESAEQDKVILRQLLHQQKSQLAADKETVDLINIKTHDLKKQLNMLGGRIPQDEIDNLSGLVGIYDSSIHTGNEALDVVLANKSLICEQRGVQFDRMIDGIQLGFMKPADIYSLFGNAIDNAMEAQTGIQDPADRYIRLKVRSDKGLVVIHIDNPYLGELRFQDGLPQTTKGDRRYHGFGMRSMELICEQYGGTMTASASDGVFSLNFLFPACGQA